ncbi:MAG: methionyl-tRNA formyltransferase [Lachnospiraceae bacterium]|nr:methionyl-tRNA formyltransferase [Lachnospiraceae bacterium]
MRIVFMGTPDFAVDTFNCLATSRHEIAAVVTQPDKPKGRSGRTSPPPVKEAAIKFMESSGRDIKILQPVKAKEQWFIDELKSIDPDAAIVAAFGQILPPEVLQIPKYGCINVHASLLPKLRGAAPIQWAVINGEKESGVTIMQMDEGLDTGDMLLVKKYALAPDETGGSLFNRLASFGGPMVLDVLDMAENGTLKPVKQDDGSHTYARMLKKEMGHIDFNAPAEDIERLIRGLDPWPGTFTRIHGKTLKICSASVIPEGEAAGNGIDINEEIPAGTVATVNKNDIIIKTGNGYLMVTSLQPEGRKRMDAGAFLRGYKIEKGERFE